MDSNPPRFWTFPRFGAALLAAWMVLPAAALNHVDQVSPLPPGRFAVACSHLEQDVARVAPGALASDYWEGRHVDGADHYISEILAHPEAVLRIDAAIPDERSLYAGHAGETVDFVAIVCHPTPRSNDDPDYVLPGTGEVIPHMQAPGAPPKLISAAEHAATLGVAWDGPSTIPARLPLIVYSHGLTGSPISKGYVDVMVLLASHGFVVSAVFHGDPRFSRVKVEDLGDFAYLLTNFERVAEMQLMRPLSLKAMTDHLLADSPFAEGIDAERIGGFGASLGGEAMALLLGARLTTSIGLRCSQPVRDPRIKAAVAFVPYAGYPYLPAFCDDQNGVQSVDRPFLALSGTADTTAPLRMMRQAIERFGSTRYLVELERGQHEFRPEDTDDLFTWMVTFLNAYLDVRSDPLAMTRLIRMSGVDGGRHDKLVVDVHMPLPNSGSEVRVLEFYNTELDHYFISGSQLEYDIITQGRAGAGWILTGEAFKGWEQMPADTFFAASPVCRFYGAIVGGPNSHFYSANPAECELVKRSSGWYYEGIAFYVRPGARDVRCPDGYLAVNRAYNNGFARNDSNHRYSTSDSTMRDMERLGWTYEGTAMCSRP